MAEIIDGSSFKKFSQSLKTSQTNKRLTDKSPSTSFHPTLFNFKNHLKTCPNSFSKFHTLLQIRQDQTFSDIYLQLQLSKRQFNLSLRKIQNHTFKAIKSKEIRKILIKEVLKCSSLSIFGPYLFVLDLGSGDYFIRTSNYGTQETQIQFNRKLVVLADSLVKQFHEVLSFIKRVTQFHLEQIPFEKKQKIFNVFKFYARLNTFPELSLKSDCADYKSLVNRDIHSNFDLQILYENHKKTVPWSSRALQSLPFYGFRIQNDDKLKYLDEFTIKNKEEIQDDLIIPGISVMKPCQNKYIFNQCYFQQKTYTQRKIGQGGNSQVFVIKTEVHEHASATNEIDFELNKNMNPAKYVSKYLTFKKDFSEANIKNALQNSKTSHEANIVTFFRGGSCLFLPKYYLNVDKQSPYYRKLFSDYLPGESLDSYLTQNSATISIYTKMYFILQILQALRFISNYGVVHLDVKEKNIIVLRRNICKLIDFGESYQPKVCGDNHKPKYTKIYGSPEVVKSANRRVFTEKSDVFSFGIMVHKILFNRYPYYFSNKQKFQKANFESSLREKTFYVPQQMGEFGHKDLIGLIYGLILRCIDMDETKRPYLDWTALIMKNCFTIFTSQ